MIRLNRRKNATFPTGVFRCEIPDASGTNQNIYIGVYSEATNTGVVIANNLTFDKRQQALSCTSTGGPPTTVSWTKDGQSLTIDETIHQQRQIIMNAASGTYVTTIYIRYPTLDQHKIVGNYSCFVSNSRVTVNGSTQHMNFKIQGE